LLLLLLFYILHTHTHQSYIFLKISFSTKFQRPILSGATVATTSDVRIAMLLLMMTGNLRVQMSDDL